MPGRSAPLAAAFLFALPFGVAWAQGASRFDGQYVGDDFAKTDVAGVL